MTAQRSGQTSAADLQSGAEQKIHENIQRARAELGDAVQQLAAKADVKARAEEAGKELADRAQRLPSQLRQHGQQLIERATKASGGMPDQVSSTAQRAAGAARKYWRQLTAAVAVAVAATIGRSFLRKRSRR